MTCGEAPHDTMMTDGGESHGGDASAVLAIRISSELAGSDFGLEIRGDGLRCACEDAVAWT